jgi:hypothetical protein
MFNPRYTSFLIIIYVFSSYYNSLYLLSSLGACVLTSSVIHHNKLIPNFRKFDVSFTFIVILYHLNLYAYTITRDYYTWLPSLFYVLGVFSYFLSLKIPMPDLPPTHIFYDKYHGYYHICGLIGNLILVDCLKNNTLQ